MKQELNVMKPVKKWHSNKTYVAEGCGDLPVTCLQDQIISIWKCSSLWERVKFLFHGEITFSLFGKEQPPISLCAGDTIKRSNDE